MGVSEAIVLVYEVSDSLMESEVEVAPSSRTCRRTKRRSLVLADLACPAIK